MADAAASAAALALDEPIYKIFRVVLTYQSCLFAVALYDWLISLKKEYRYIWRAKFTVVSALYVGLRYFEFVRSAITIYLANSMIAVEKCPPWAKWQVYSAMVETTIVFVLFTLRASALYGNSKLILGFLATLGFTILALEGVASVQFGTIPYATGRGPCFAGATPTSSNILVIFWLGPFVFDTVTTLLLLGRIVVIRRRGGSDSSIVRLLARDGIVYFFIISAANLINVGFYLGAAADIQSVNSAMAYAVTSVMSSRLILSLRHHAAMNDPLSNKTSHPVFTKHAGRNDAYSQHHGGAMDAFGVRTERGEKGVTDIGGTVGSGTGNGMQAHIALSNLNSTFRKGDEESLDGHQTQTIPGVYVVTETKTAVDEHRHI